MKKLAADGKAENRELSRGRILVENINAKIKVFKITAFKVIYMNNEKGTGKGCSKIICRVIGAIIVLISLPFTLGAINSVWTNVGIMSDISRLKRNGVLTQATISEINAHYFDGRVDPGFKSFDEESPIYYEVFIDFVIADNQFIERVHLTALSSEVTSAGHVGSIVEIYYNPENPYDIAPAKYKSSWVPIGILPLSLGLLLIFSNFYITVRVSMVPSDNFDTQNRIDYTRNLTYR